MENLLMNDFDFWVRDAWKRVMAKSGTVEFRAIESIHAAEARGLCVPTAENLIEAGNKAYNNNDTGELLKAMAMINEAIRSASRSRVDYHKPRRFCDISSCFPASDLGPGYRSSCDNLDYYSRVHGSWLGKCIGTSLGDPVAGWPPTKVFLKYGYIDHYLAKPDTRNDDTNFPIVVLHCLDQHDYNLDSRELGYEWVEHLPLQYTFTAERIAMQNLMRGITPPFSALENNPFCEWIGAQMRAEIHGLLFPGRPAAAASYAYRDAIISHDAEAVYSAIFNAVTISLAFVTNDVEQLIHDALQYVPKCSDLYATISNTIETCNRFKDWEKVINWIESAFKSYHWIHTYPNIAIVVMSILLGNGDFSESIKMCASSGMDADCTTGQVGATVGALVGERSIPPEWKRPIGDMLATDVRGFERLKISDLASWTCRTSEKVTSRLDNI